MKAIINKVNPLLFIIIAGITFSFTTSKTIQSEADWVLLGEKKVNMTADHDELIVGASEGVFTKIKFRVANAPLYVRNVNIVFRNGDQKNIVIKQKFKKNAESRVFDLPGNKRIIKKIKFNYKTAKKAKKRSVLYVLARH